MDRVTLTQQHTYFTFKNSSESAKTMNAKLSTVPVQYEQGIRYSAVIPFSAQQIDIHDPGLPKPPICQIKIH